MKRNQMLKDEIIYSQTLKSGLDILVHPKPEFVQTVCTLQVNFGGGDIEYEIEGKKHALPEGTAHFLEHVIFDNNGRNLSEVFANKGADINAYTARSMTAYNFTCQSDFYFLLDYLLGSFYDVDFSEESVNKERNIIERELAMSEDDISFAAETKIKRMMFADKRATVKIGGTAKEIEKIDRVLLKEVFNTFYHPKNMAMIITGPVVPEEVFDFLENHNYNNYVWPQFSNIKKTFLIKKTGPKNYTKYDSAHEVNYVEFSIKLCRNAFDKINNPAKLNLIVGAFASTYFGKSSKIYKELKAKNLINYSYGFDSTIENDFGFISIYSETKRPAVYVKTLKRMIQAIEKREIDLESFEANKKRAIGNFVRMFDNIQSINDFVSTNYAKGINVYNYLKDVSELTISDVAKFKEIFLNEGIYTVSYLKPLK